MYKRQSFDKSISIARPLTARRDEARDVILADEIVQVVVGLQNHAAAPSAVAAARPALGDVSLAMERDAAFAAVPLSLIHI